MRPNLADPVRVSNARPGGAVRQATLALAREKRRRWHEDALLPAAPDRTPAGARPDQQTDCLSRRTWSVDKCKVNSAFFRLSCAETGEV
eukprot:3020744-Rhodomonas_salina.2